LREWTNAATGILPALCRFGLVGRSGEFIFIFRRSSLWRYSDEHDGKEETVARFFLRRLGGLPSGGSFFRWNYMDNGRKSSFDSFAGALVADIDVERFDILHAGRLFPLRRDIFGWHHLDSADARFLGSLAITCVERIDLLRDQ
jgi:hypothetical protein